MSDVVQEAEAMLTRVRILQLYASFAEDAFLFALVVRKATASQKRLADVLEVTNGPSM